VPTLLDLLGESMPAEMDGQSLRPLMTGAVQSLGLEAYSESQYGFDNFGWSPLKALRRGSLKLIAAPRPELYDLASDPHELTNLYAHRAAAVSEMTARLRQVAQPSARPSADAPVIDEAARDRLAALGYVSGPRRDPPVDAATPLIDPKDQIEFYRQFAEQRQTIGGIP
jgi:arylsulfatase A-like enzyme